MAEHQAKEQEIFSFQSYRKMSVEVNTVVSWLLGLFYYCCYRLLLYVHRFEDILYLLLTAQFCYKAYVEISSLNETSLA